MRCEFLPPYSPDYNPVEPLLSSMKYQLRRNGAYVRFAMDELSDLEIYCILCEALCQASRLLVVSVSLDGEQFAERVMEGGTWCWFSHITVLPRVVTAIFVAMITPSVCAIVNCSLSWTSGRLVFFHMTGTKCNGIALRSGKVGIDNTSTSESPHPDPGLEEHGDSNRCQIDRSAVAG